MNIIDWYEYNTYGFDSADELLLLLMHIYIRLYLHFTKQQ